jgi:hypothetical protein
MTGESPSSAMLAESPSSGTGRGAVLARQRELPGIHAHDVAFSHDGKKLAIAGESGDVVVIDPHLDQPMKAPLVRLGSLANRVEGAGLTADSARLAVHVWYDGQMAFDLHRGGLDQGTSRLTYNTTNQFTSDGTRYGEPFSVMAKGDRVEFRGVDDRLLATLVVLDKIGGWVVVDPFGRFDTNMDLGDVKGVHWTPVGRPLEALPLDHLVRDYFEPRLLPRLLAGAPMADPPRLDYVNRKVPKVEIMSVTPWQRDTAIVRVRVNGGRAGESPAAELRLLRDGRMVGRRPARGHEILETDFEVALPCSGTPSAVRFTAYAFNEDGVKSEAASQLYGPHSCKARQPTAYVVTIGVNTSEDPRWNLQFAVNDARALGAALSQIDGYRVVPVSLTSDGPDWTKGLATKRKIRAVFARLAGQTGEDGDLAGVAGAHDLARSTPDDVVIVTFGGHGLTDQRGEFYLLPSDVGPAVGFGPASLAKLISSRELGEWLEPIDAGEMALVLDACRSSASVDQPGFKPAPLAGGGLGQTAYVKAMSVLAAGYTSAVESQTLKHGHMTYALVHDALLPVESGRRAADVDGDGRLTLSEWFHFAVRRTPELTAGEPNAQNPTLFEWSRESRGRASIRPPAASTRGGL